MTTLRPMRDADVEAVEDLHLRTFEDLDRREGKQPEPRPAPLWGEVRARHLLATDPGGAWVAERDGAVIGCAMALMREAVWGLSRLVVDPADQSAGLGRALLDRAHAYGTQAGARGWLILASSDHRALRAYVGLGLDLHPAMVAVGHPRDVAAPAELRAPEPGDRGWMDELGRALRGAPHGDDLAAFARGGGTVRVLPGAGYLVARGAALKLLAAADEAAAETLLRAHLAAAEGEASVEWLTSAQQWAIRTCVAAGLRLQPGWGGVLTGGELGTLRPYLPSGAYL
jgi:ribosomal protein S18 acetylase RimI-like enzyme